MKKLFSLVLMLVIAFSVNAQTPSSEQKRLLFNKVDTLISNYIKYSSLLESGKSAISDTTMKNFKGLFVSDDVMLPDEMSLAYFEKSRPKPQLPSSASMDAEAQKLKGKLPSYDAANLKRLSTTNQYIADLDSYSKKLDDQRSSFYQAYNNLEKNMNDYRVALNAEEGIVTRKLSEYIQASKANYPEGFSVKLFNSSIDLKNISGNEIKLLIDKRTLGTVTSSGLKLENRDTLLLTLKISQNYSKVAISKIEMTGHQITRINDKDRDFVIDSKDACKDEQGMFQENGCPSTEEKNYAAKMKSYLTDRATDSAAVIASKANANVKMKVLADQVAFWEKKISEPAHWWITLGVAYGSVSSSLTNATSGYAPSLLNQLDNSEIKFSSGSSFGGDLMLEHYFGKKSNFGIEIGLSYNSFSGTLQKDSFHTEYLTKDRASNGRLSVTYLQIIKSKGALEEKIKANSMSIPILLSYKTNFSEKIGFKLEAGIVYNMQYKSTTKSSTGKFDMEAIYTYTSGNSTNGVKDNTSWLITQDAVSHHITGTGTVESYFADLRNRGYTNVGLHVDPTSIEGNASFGSGIGFIIRPSIAYNFSKASYISLGVFYSSNSFSNSQDGYRLIDENGLYKSLMQGASKISNSSFGIRVSYTHSLFYNLAKWTKELSGLR